MSNKIYVGIDVGSNGAIVVLFPKGGTNTYLMPKINDRIDLLELSKIFHSLKELESFNIHICFEDLHAIYGSSAKSTFNFGWINGVIESFCVAYNLPYTKVQAKEWQKEMFKGIIPIFKPGLKVKKTDTKAMSIMACKRLYPLFNLKATERTKKDHDGIADALMIATYSQRKLL